MKIFLVLISTFTSIAIWLYLLYKILAMVQATELMWFLYWIYIPISVVLGVAVQLNKD